MYIFYRLHFSLTLPHNQRETNRGAKLMIKMVGKTTYISDLSQPNAEPKKFSFDFSYWSHDGFKENDEGYLTPESAAYADQVW